MFSGTGLFFAFGIIFLTYRTPFYKLCNAPKVQNTWSLKMWSLKILSNLFIFKDVLRNRFSFCIWNNFFEHTVHRFKIYMMLS